MRRGFYFFLQNNFKFFAFGNVINIDLNAQKANSFIK